MSLAARPCQVFGWGRYFGKLGREGLQRGKIASGVAGLGGLLGHGEPGEAAPGGGAEVEAGDEAGLIVVRAAG